MEITLDLTPEQEAAMDSAKQRKANAIDLDDPATNKPKSQATLLIEIGSQYRLFHDADRNAYAIVPRKGAMEVWPIRSEGFRHILAGEFFELTSKGFSRNAAGDALDTLEAKAIHTGKQHTVYLRVARVGGALYLDLCDDAWRVIEVRPEGWKILDRAPVHFIRKRGMEALPIPSGFGDVGHLANLINMDHASGHFELVVSWMIGALRGRSPYPILVLQGEQGTGKSTASRIIRRFIDPSTVPLRAPPKEPRDLIVSAVNNHLVCLDNLSGINAEISDCLCRFATGGGLDLRKLYTDSDTVMIDIQRPVLVNGIDDIANRPDLAERAVILHLPVLEAPTRVMESKLWEEADKHSPAIMAGLLNALSAALANEATTHLERKPRMADFAVWATAAESALPWERGGFMTAYEAMRERAVEEGIDSSPVGSVLVEYLLGLSPITSWSPTPTHLFQTLSEKAGERARSQAWPRTSKGMGMALNRIAPNLRAIGITFTKKHTDDRSYRFVVGGNVQSSEKAPEAPESPKPAPGKASGAGASPAHPGGQAHRSAEAPERKAEAPDVLPIKISELGATGGSGAFSGQCTTTMSAKQFTSSDRGLI